KAAGEALTVKKAPHRPGTARRTVCAPRGPSSSYRRPHAKETTMWWRTQFQSPRSRATVRRSRRLLLEPLEDRSLLTFLGPVSYPVGTPDAHSAADFDNDGILDLIVKNASMVSMMRGNGDGTFQPAVDFNADTTASLGGGTYSLAVEDFNTD